MDDRHLDREALEKFLSDELTEEESRALQRHVFTCSECEDRLVRLLPGTRTRRSRRPPAGDEHRELIRRVADEKKAESVASRSTLGLERREAPALFAELEAHGPEERRNRVWNDPRYQTWGFFELLIDRSHQILPQEPRKAEDLVRLALDVAGLLDASRYGAPALEAARTRARTHLGNTFRVLSDFRQAEQAFHTAELHFERSWLDPLDEGLLLESRAAMRRAQGRFNEALML